MKHYAFYALFILLTCTFYTGFSQSNNSKPKQFNNFPATINCTEQELTKVFNAAPGQSISLSFANNFIFSGTVTSNLVKYSNLQSAVIVLPVYDNTIFHVSRITNADRTTSFIGRIVNKNYFDGFELKKNAAGIYQLNKIETDRVMQDCTNL